MYFSSPVLANFCIKGSRNFSPKQLFLGIWTLFSAMFYIKEMFLSKRETQMDHQLLISKIALQLGSIKTKRKGDCRIWLSLTSSTKFAWNCTEKKLCAIFLDISTFFSSRYFQFGLFLTCPVPVFDSIKYLCPNRSFYVTIP